MSNSTSVATTPHAPLKKPRPSSLGIATAAVTRLTREKSSYVIELQEQEVAIQKVEAETGDGEDGNRDWRLRQVRQALHQTEAIFEPLEQRLSDARSTLQELLNQGEGTPEERLSAQEVLGTGSGV